MGVRQSKKVEPQYKIIPDVITSDGDLTKFLEEFSKTVVLSQDYFYFNDKPNKKELDRRSISRNIYHNCNDTELINIEAISRGITKDDSDSLSDLCEKINDITPSIEWWSNMREYTKNITSKSPYFTKTKHYEYQLRKGGILKEEDKIVIDQLTNAIKIAQWLEHDTYVYKDVTKEYESVLESAIESGVKYFWEYSFFTASFNPYFKDTSTILRIKVPKNTPCLWIEDVTYDFMFQRNSYLEYIDTKKMELFNGEKLVPMNVYDFHLHSL